MVVATNFIDVDWVMLDMCDIVGSDSPRCRRRSSGNCRRLICHMRRIVCWFSCSWFVCWFVTRPR